MALNQAQIDGAAARAAVLRVWPTATSTYTGTNSAQVYDGENVLGEATVDEDVVEHAWIQAAQSIKIEA